MNLYTAINYKTRKTEADSCALLVAKNVVAKNVVAKNATKTKWKHTIFIVEAMYLIVGPCNVDTIAKCSVLVVEGRQHSLVH